MREDALQREISIAAPDSYDSRKELKEEAMQQLEFDLGHQIIHRLEEKGHNRMVCEIFLDRWKITPHNLYDHSTYMPVDALTRQYVVHPVVVEYIESPPHWSRHVHPLEVRWQVDASVVELQERIEKLNADLAEAEEEVRYAEYCRAGADERANAYADTISVMRETWGYRLYKWVENLKDKVASVCRIKL